MWCGFDPHRPIESRSRGIVAWDFKHKVSESPTLCFIFACSFYALAKSLYIVCSAVIWEVNSKQSRLTAFVKAIDLFSTWILAKWPTLDRFNQVDDGVGERSTLASTYDSQTPKQMGRPQSFRVRQPYR